jgi:hypothetical protein
MQEPGQESTVIEAAYSSRLPASFALFDRDTSSWKTSQRSLLGDWTEFSGRWPRSGTMRNGTAYLLPPLVPRISATECSYLPTPTDASKGGGSSRSGDRINEIPTLQGMARAGKWPDIRFGTPNSHPRTHTPRDVDHGVQLANQIGGPLNPPWVEWLMGFPIGWTDCELSETQSSHKSPNGSDGESSSQ